MRDSKGRSTEIYTVKGGDQTALVGLAFSGSEQQVVLNQARMQAGGNE